MAFLLTRCPGKSAVEYIYVNWSRWFTNGDVPKGYPLIYEPECGQHGNGINVVLVDDSGFWDENCRWITAFENAHTNYGMRLPNCLLK